MLLQRLQGRIVRQLAPSLLSVSFSSSSRQLDHYQTLEISKSASQKDIKAQFYKLSKRWHPDVNSDSENANVKFQQVSEAYATLGSEASRKDYDRQMIGSRHGSTRGANRGFRYASDNVARRATASYAWDYQKRRAQSGGANKNSTGNGATQGRSQYHEFGRGGASSSSSPTGSFSMFEQFAQRERKREAAAAARMNDAGKSSSDKGGYATREEYEAQTSSPLLRFAQVTSVFYIIFYLGTRFASTKEPRRTTAR